MTHVFHNCDPAYFIWQQFYVQVSATSNTKASKHTYQILWNYPASRTLLKLKDSIHFLFWMQKSIVSHWKSTLYISEIDANSQDKNE